jgi:EpsI family protein
MVSGYIVWIRWKNVLDARSAPDYVLGTFLMVIGAVFLVVGHIGALMSLQGVSLIVTLAGLVFVLGGRGVLRVLWFPLLYLSLMLPFWGFLFARIEGPSQAFSATVATSMLRAVGIPAFLQDTKIVLPSISLDVMAECSGIKQLIALTVVVLPAGYLWLETHAARITLMTAAIGLGYLGNGMRIAALGLLATNGVDISDPHALIHLLPGFATAALTYLSIWGCLSLLVRFESYRSRVGKPSAPANSPVIVAHRPWVEASLLAVLLCAGASQLMATSSVEGGAALSSLPARIGDWALEKELNPVSTRFSGFDDEFTGTYPAPGGEHRFVEADDQVMRTYQKAGGSVQIYIGYYRRQRDGKELSGDASRALQRAASPITIPSELGPFQVNEIVQHKDDGDRGVIFWYDLNGRIVRNIYLAKGYMLIDAITRRRTNGAVVMVAWDTRDGGELARQNAVAFARGLVSILRSHLPS